MPAALHLPLRHRAAVLFVGFACLVAAAPVIAGLVVMHGFADLTSALVWIQADAPGTVAVTWRPDGEAADRRLELAAIAGNDNVVVARLTGLQPGMGAAYRIDTGSERREGSVRAQPFWTRQAEAPPITIAIGSCFFLGDANPRCGQAAARRRSSRSSTPSPRIKPDLMLWLGDNLYLQRPDFLDPASMAMRYRRQRAFAPLQRLLTAAPQLAIWDDHDYGPNDSDASYVLKGETLRLFQRYWPNLSHGLPDVPGSVRLRAIRRRAVLPARRSLPPVTQPLARWRGQDDVRATSARLAQAGADVGAANEHQDHRRRQPVLEPRQPLRGLAPIPHRAEGLRRLARRSSRSTA